MTAVYYRQFNYLLMGQVLALFGSSLSGFALGIWAYKTVGSTTFYTAIALANILPMFLLSPIAGAIVDKWNRKQVVLLANAATLGIITLLFFLHTENLLRPWHILGLVTLNSLFAAFVLPAVSASIPLMVPKDQLTRANGFIAMALGLVELATPAVAGTLFSHFGLSSVLIGNGLALITAMLILLACTVPQPAFSSEAEKERVLKQNLRESLMETCQFLLKHPSFSRLIVFYAIIVSLTLSVAMLVQPMLLGLTDAKTMGITLSAASSGILFGSLLVITLKQVSRHFPILVMATGLVGLGCLILPMFTTPWMIALGGFFVMGCYPVFDSHHRSLFQRKIPAERLGRVLGIRNFILGLSQAIMFIIIGPLSDHIFEPAMQQGGDLNPLFGAFYGQGQGRGIAVLISCFGILILLTSFLALFSTHLRRIDDLEDTQADTETPSHDAQSAEAALSENRTSQAKSGGTCQYS